MHQMLRRIRAVTATGNNFYFHLELNAAYLRMLKLTCGGKGRVRPFPKF